MAREPSSIQEALEWLRDGFRPEVARDMCVTYQIELAGEAGGTFRLSIDAGQLSARQGCDTPADVVFRLSAADFFGLLAGRENPDMLFMAERLRVDGDLALALELRKLFAAPAQPK